MSLAAGVALLLALTSLTLPGSGGGVLPIDDPEPTPVLGGPTITMSIDNFGEPASLLDPDNRAWAHLTANAAPITVTVTIQPGVDPVRGYTVQFSAPDAFQGPQVQYCADQWHTFDVPIQCQFVVPVSRGENRIDVEFHTFSGPGIVSHGAIYGGELAVSAQLQVLDAGSIWRTIPDDGFEVPGERRSAVRYVIVNIGDIPFQPSDACRSTLLQPGSFIACPVRTARPAFALAGDYAVPVHLNDPAGGVASFLVEGRVIAPGMALGPNAAGPRMSG
ncbi:hypothetical protein BH11ACT3_BH11ACT3_18090 [soil metagenome]